MCSTDSTILNCVERCYCLQVTRQQHILKLQAWTHLKTLNLSLSSMQTGKSYNYALWSTCKKWDPWNNVDSSIKMPWTYFYKLQNGAALTYYAWADSLLSLMLSSSAFFQYMAWAYWASPPHLLHFFTQFSRAMQQLFSLLVWSHVLPTFVEALWCLHPKLTFW